MVRSRLSKKREQTTKRNLYLSIAGLVIAILVVLRFGIPFLINFSLFLSGIRGQEETVSAQKQSFIAPPILDYFPEATSSANIVITGYALEKQTVNLYINSNFADATQADEDGKFVFREAIKPGENTIKAKVVEGEKESDFSRSITTVYRSAPPSLSIDSPFDGQIFSKDQVIEIKGTTDPDVKVTINGYWAITDNDGNYTYNLTLQSGDNEIKVIAEDTAGNKAEKQIKVNYSP